MSLIFLDVETTGLNPQTCALLELAAVAVNDNLEPVSGFACVIQPGIIPPMEDYVQRMHTANGLLQDVQTRGTHPEAAQAAFLSWLDKHRSGGSPNLAGASVHFDRAFLEVHMHTAWAMFSHQLLDVTALHLARKVKGLPPCPLAKADGHRATSDVLATLAQARWLMSRMVE